MIYSFKGLTPMWGPTNYIAPSADVLGDVAMGPFTSVWFNVTIRGDIHSIRIGRECNVQDNTVIHVTGGTGPVHIQDRVTIGHGAIVHACTIERNVLIGMGAVILDNAVIGHSSIVGASALVTARTVVPPRSLVLGAPAKVVRELTDEEVWSINRYADNYLRNSAAYKMDRLNTR